MSGTCRCTEINGAIVAGVKLRQGVNTDVLRDLFEQPSVEEPLLETKAEWKNAAGLTRRDADGGFAALQIGELFRSELWLV